MILARAATPPRGIPGPENGPASWLYCGREGSRLPDWESGLGPSWRRANLSHELQEAAKSLRRPYLQWIDALNARHGADPFWWATQIAERSPFAEPMFLHACFLRVILDRAEAGTAPALVVCESGGLLEALRSETASRGFPVRVHGGSGLLLDAAADALKLVVRSAGFFLRAARALPPFRGGRGPAGKKTRPRVLMATYAHETSFGADGRFTERNFCGLHDWIEEKGIEVWILPTLYDIRRSPAEARSWMRAAKGRFVVAEDRLTALDHLRALLGAWRSLGLPREAPPLAGLGASPLLTEARRRQARSPESHEARLTYLLCRRLARDGFDFDLLLGWFENLRAEKCLALGFKRAFPKAKRLGWLSILPNPNYLSVFPLPEEERAGALPDRILCCGRQQASVLGAYGGGVPAGVAGAMRYRYLWNEEDAAGTEARKTVFLPLPTRLSDCAEILGILREVMALETGADRWLVKPHPDTPIEAVRARVGPDLWPGGIEVRSESMRTLLAESAVVLSAGSGTLAEAACRGIPAVVIRSRSDLDFNPLEWFPEAPAPTDDPSEIAARIREALAAGPEASEARREFGRRVRRDCFEEVTEKSLSPFLDAFEKGAMRA